MGLDLELRLVRYFTVVAKHLNFSRAAEELHLAQPSLSRQIGRLEQRLGARLLERTPQGNHLTAAGRAFLPEAQDLLRAANRAAHVARAHAAEGHLVIGYLDDLIITPAVSELRVRHPQATIETRHLTCQTLLSFEDGQIDVLIGRTPFTFPAGNLWTKTLYEEARVLVVATSHPLAGQASVHVNEVADEKPYPCTAPTVDGWMVHRLLGEEPQQTRPVEAYEDKLELIASGRAIGIQPAGDRRTLLHPGVTTVVLDGAPPSDVVVAGRIGEVNPLVQDFSDIIVDRCRTRPVPAAR
nr:LysR family transcriptional regulator [Kineosporia babensis]